MNSYPNKTINIAIHILIWLVILSMPYIVAYLTTSNNDISDIGAIIMPIQVLLIFYINYLFLIKKFLFNKKLFLFVVTNIALIAIITTFMIYVRHNILPPPHFHKQPLPNDAFRHLPAIMNIIVQFLVVGLSVAIKVTSDWYNTKQKIQELEKENAKAALQQLKTQLNPHFLFNSLNNIYALIAFDQDKAQISLLNLCDMLRYQLYEANRETIPLEKEVEFVRNYCELMQLRLSKQVSVSVDLPANCKGINIAPLLFISIVENAFKHGVSQNGISYIVIKIKIEKEFVSCLVMNSYFPKADNDRSGSGIGIENLRRRLKLLYPNSHTFKAEKRNNDFIAELTIKTTI